MYRRTESMIALRARRQAYAVASDILYPPAEVPAPALPPIQAESEDQLAQMKRERALRWKEFERTRRISRILRYCSLILLALLVLSALMAALLVT